MMMEDDSNDNDNDDNELMVTMRWPEMNLLVLFPKLLPFQTWPDLD